MMPIVQSQTVIRKLSLLPIFVVVFISLLLLIPCTKAAGQQQEIALGTLCAINLFENGSKQLGSLSAVYARIFSRIHEIDQTMTAHESPVSDVLAINAMAGIGPVKVRSDVLDVLERALYYAALSGGAFDPTVGPLVQLWGIGTDTPTGARSEPAARRGPGLLNRPASHRRPVPNEDEIAAALELVNWRDLEIDREAGTAFLRRKGMALDLGAIAKGYAGDEAARIAKAAKVKRAIIDLGGNIVALGWRQPREFLPWRIGIQNPLDEQRGAYLGILPAHDTSIVTSGVYERYFEYGGKRYHHLFSTETGYPVENGLLSVTVITASSTAADALSMAVFALGYAQGKALIDSLPGTEAIFVFDDCRVSITAGLHGLFTLTNDAFTVY